MHACIMHDVHISIGCPRNCSHVNTGCIHVCKQMILGVFMNLQSSSSMITFTTVLFSPGGAVKIAAACPENRAATILRRKTSVPSTILSSETAIPFSLELACLD